MDNCKFGVDKWKNGAGERIEKKLKKIYEKMGSVVEVQRFNHGIGEYSVRLTNDHCLVVRLRDETCSGKWWQIRGLLCIHAMAVIEREKLYVYDYVNPCYKAPTQRTIYMNAIHPIEIHDTGVVDGDTGLVLGGDDLDEDFNRHILPPKNPRGAGRLRKRRIESQTQGLKPHRCFKCGDLGHCKNICRNPRADFDADYPSDVIPDDYACGYFEEVDPEYPNRAMEVIDDLVIEMREARDVLLEERNNQYWMEEEDRAIEDGMRAELDELKGVVGVAFTAILVLVAALLVPPVRDVWREGLSSGGKSPAFCVGNPRVVPGFAMMRPWVDHPLTRAEKVSVLNLDWENRKLKAAVLSKQAMLRAAQSQQQ
ncbi:hypothetical protein Cgig2_013731 [Carnegiea gigantea]|uniref:CCHC-type domain-containing protein n=1 Tax=Carnegiea gigantea TaxID=171969 RepID=A0A9Q1JWE1_9CARY|nr:hypothetical protein Cgig2_013731 [Carnegiea gigantea]